MDCKYPLSDEEIRYWREIFDALPPEDKVVLAQELTVRLQLAQADAELEQSSPSET